MAKVALLAIAVLAARAGAQTRTIDLTGQPLVTIREPFTAPSGFNEVTGNRAVIIDRKDNQLVLVDFSSNSIRTIGRQGAGPKEYKRIDKAFPWPGGGTLLPDPSNNRAVLVAADGALSLANFSRETIGIAGAGQIGGTDRAGNVYVFGMIPRVAGAGSESPDSLPIARWVPANHHVDTLGWWPQPKVTVGPPEKRNGATVRALGHTSMFPDYTVWRALPDGGIAIVHPAPYRVDLIDTRGRLHRGPAVARERINLDATERDALRAQRGPMPDASFQKTYPPFSGVTDDVFVTPEGSVWVERFRRMGDSASVYDVFDGSGQLSAQARLRPHSRVLGFGANSVYIVRQTTDDDFWHLEQWRRPP